MAGRQRFWHWALLFCAFVFVMPGMALAANHCPWLNEATASGYLGGDAVGAFVAAAPPALGSCTFVQNAAGGARTLVITVIVSSNAKETLSAMERGCGSVKQPVTAIGNDALRCFDRKRGNSERIIGRVRDQVFSVSIRTHQKQDSILTPEELEMRIYSAAEEVAGNLF